mmetsp:Transcript_62516/g.182776  ORF Transcript_62516/g.182776 Transcript_62516/m.182776 type:complete len:375 (-) Transcript_62516:196-1320(-)
MAWDRDSYGHRDRDPMGAQGDTLFADPLGVRAGSHKAQSSSARQRNDFSSMPGGAFGVQDDRVVDLQRQEEEEESWGPIGSFFWYVFAGGKQCCSMRDRTKPQELEAAKKAGESGRPPQSFFPEPPRQGAIDHTFGAQQESRDRAPFNADSDRGFGGLQKPSASQPSQSAPFAARQQYPQRGMDDSDSDSDSDQYRSRPGQKDRPDVSSFSGWKQPQPDSSKSQAKGGNVSSEKPPAAAGNSSGSGSPPSQEIVSKGASAEQMPKRWEWPSWCLNFKSPCIEVYVVDDETGVGKWVEAEPQSRVVDKAGRDAYLCVEYEWDGEYYVQDFGPQHVRRRGHQMTVFQMFEKAAGDSAQSAGKAHDTGGGISAFLGD